MGVGARIICDSVSANHSRLTTMEIELHRFILPEFNTHRKFSRNFQSSRAIPLARQREMVEADPALPVFWGANRAGMVADDVLSGEKIVLAKSYWYDALTEMCNIHKKMEELGVHKQIANRLLEPFMYTKGVVSGTDDAFNHFFKLRCHKDAQPEIQALANAMKKAYDESKPTKLKVDEWHLPYVTPEDREKYHIENLIKISVSSCAQVSYRNLDTSLEKANIIFDRLSLIPEKAGGNPPHASPCEHIAQACVASSRNTLNGNFNNGWRQLRQMLEV